MRHLITAGLPYINGIKHLGNLVGSMLPADVYARFLRQQGDEVLYICATDEHGAPAEIAAEKAGQAVEAFCDEQHALQADIYRRFNLSFDWFGRTSRQPNHDLTQEIFAGLDQGGFIDKRSLRQIYSVDDGRYLADRFVTGTCPHCGYDRARGDQCENCTKLLDPTDLIDPRSTLSGSTNLEFRDQDHLFLKLPALGERVGAWVESKDGVWPDLSMQIARKWLGEGLQDRCITRALKWGVQVPGHEDLDLRFYVWFDAPIGYIAATREWSEGTDGLADDAWTSWWRGPEAAESVHYTQFMGKDNLPFHTVMFPAMLMGSSPDWKVVDVVKGFHWLDYYGGKFSTSLGRGVFTHDALDLYPADYWRYVLMAAIPETSDSTFTWALFAGTVNKDLAGVLGNFVNRVLKFTKGKFGLTVPEGGENGPAEVALIEEVTASVAEYERCMRALEFRSAMRELRRLWTLGNGYINDEAPWKAIKVDRERAAVVIRMCFNLIHLYAVASAPVMPTIATDLLKAVRREGQPLPPASSLVGLDTVKAGEAFVVIPPAIAKVESDAVAEHEARFGTGDA